MKYFRLILFIAAFFASESANANEWRTYLSYDNPQQIVSTNDYIYVMANNSLYSYNKKDSHVQTFSKADILSDVTINFIVWSKAVKKLVIIYNNGNIDLMNSIGTEVENISDYFRASTTDDKTINYVFVQDNIMLLATNFGIVKVDIKKGEIMETYKLNNKITKVDIVNNKILGLCGNYLFTGDMNDNLLDYSKWKVTKNDYAFPNKNDIPSAQDSLIVKSVKTEGPKNNQISRLKFYNDRLFVAAGGRIEGEPYRFTAKLQELSNGEWFYYDDYNSFNEILYTREVNDIAIDPFDSKHVFVSTFGNGVYEFQNGKQLNNFTINNNDLLFAAAANNPNYVRTGGVCFIPSGNLYFLNMQSENALIEYTKDRKFISHKPDVLYGLKGNDKLSWANFCGTVLDEERNALWFVNDNYLTPALYYYNYSTGNAVRFNTFVNQDGSTIADLGYVHCVAKDMENNIWVGTNQGPLMLTQELMENSKEGFIQVKVPRNDGTNYADYLLAGVDITCIAVDAAGRKWFGTNGSGVYLISADNIEQIHNFTTDNSSILSNDIRDIAINNKTGEVFFATNNGLCSFISDATEAFEEMTKEHVWAYPNPVRPDYNGEITVVGLSINATVTITTSSGHIVASGKSIGGSFKWNGCDKNGKRVASGIYMVHTATSTGESGVVTKIAVVN